MKALANGLLRLALLALLAVVATSCGHVPPPRPGAGDLAAAADYAIAHPDLLTHPPKEPAP